MTTIMNRLLRPIGPLRPHIELWNTASRIRSIRAVSTTEGTETSDKKARAKRLTEIEQELQKAKEIEQELKKATETTAETGGEEVSTITKKIKQLKAEQQGLIKIQTEANKKAREEAQAKIKADEEAKAARQEAAKPIPKQQTNKQIKKELLAEAKEKARAEAKAAIAEARERVAAEAMGEIAEARARERARAIRKAEEEARLAAQNNTFYRSSEEPYDDSPEAKAEFWAKRTHDEIRELLKLSEDGVAFTTAGASTFVEARKYFKNFWHQELHAMFGYLPCSADYTVGFGDMVSLSDSQMIETRQLT